MTTQTTTLKSLADLNKNPQIVRPSAESSDPQTTRTEYRVGKAGTTWSGRTGAKMHLLQVAVVVAFDAEKEAAQVKEYPARATIYWAKIGEIQSAYPLCGGYNRAAIAEDADTDAITCTKCLKVLDTIATTQDDEPSDAPDTSADHIDPAAPRPLWMVSVSRRDHGWAVYKDGKRISAWFEKGQDALEHAVAQGWQVGYRGKTYNDGGYLNGVPADKEVR